MGSISTNQDWFATSQMRERHYDIGSSLVLWNQWGDEWKWKVTDRLAQESDVIMRFQWWHNAGHSVQVGDKKFDLHILPSGVISEWKINLITSWCVLWIRLWKINLDKIQATPAWIICHATLDGLSKYEEWEKIQVWLVPELETLKAWGIDIQKSGLKISGETTVIWMHNVIIDAFEEVSRVASGLRAIGSTGSGIGPAYASKSQRYHFTLSDLLYREDIFYDSIKTLWERYSRNFPNISVDDLIASMRQEKQDILKYIERREIEIIDHEKTYIDELSSSEKILLWEWAQWAMIWESNSYFGTPSSPCLQAFLKVTWLTADKVWNIFLIHKFPYSSVWERPWYLKFPDSPELDQFRDDYEEYGVSTKRPRDLFRYSLPETARWVSLSTWGIDDESKIVPVYNRIDGVEDALSLDNWLLRVVTWFSYNTQKIIWGKYSPQEILVWVHGDEILSPDNLLSYYPEKSMQMDLFNVTSSDLRLVEIQWNIEQKIEQLVWCHNAAVFSQDHEREFLVGTWTERNDLEMRIWSPLRTL